MGDSDLPENACQASGNSGLDQASSAAKHHNKEGQPDLSGLTVADSRKCNYAMHLCASGLSSVRPRLFAVALLTLSLLPPKSSFVSRRSGFAPQSTDAVVSSVAALAKLPGEKLHPEQAKWVWPIWRCADLAVG